MLKVLLILLMSASASASYSQGFPEEPDKVPAQFAISLLEAREANSLGAAPSSAEARSISELGLALIIDFEGFVKNGNLHIPYNDAAGYCTIGYGRLIKKERCRDLDLGDLRRGITEEQAVAFLKEDLSFARLAVQRNTVYDRDSNGDGRKDPIEANNDQFSALVSFIFNVGERNYKRSTLLRRMQQDRNELAAREFLRWVRADGRIYEGLIARRECEQSLFRSALSFDSDGKFARSNCSSLGIASTPGDLIDILVGESTP
ncbi:lysozyme [Sinorhizobium medicae]|uniref:Lysozyme n=1 Tax=Sinorhizobium medicae (strain WSM419) TaxID=366394 RepID=A6UN41_SINMW|nr:lysozyme [Sinorhizobium medicae]ABR65071.1 glycoside hydrolase family 24 [Sinorhizobium medicae WSM419]